MARDRADSAASGACDWCEEVSTSRKLFTRHQGDIRGFCSHQCFDSYAETEFKTPCEFCGKIVQKSPVTRAHLEKLLQVPDDLDRYCNLKCFQSKLQNQSSSASDKSKDDSIQSTLDQSTDANVTTGNMSGDLNSSQVQFVQQSSPLFSPGSTCKKSSRRTEHYEIFGCFNWNDYLQEEGTVPAPDECFKQHPVPPENEFELNMKLEAVDPRNPTSTCIASVVSIMGARIQLRLDGSDNTNDFWELVDSQAIKPIGYTEQHGGMLQPPLGFRKNPAHWPIFVTNTLSGAVIAPESCFKPTPRSPTRNYFTEGSKLEAVDKKNPRLICPATIQRVKDDMVFVSFDGWKGAFDYWSRYDSRDLFPVGWCQKSNHPLQLPGNKDLKISESKLSWVWPSKVPLQTINKTSSRTGTVLPLRQVTTSPTNGSGTKDGVKENLSTQPTVLSQSPPSSIKTIPIEPSTSTTTSTTATVTSNTSASPTTHNSKCTPTPQDLKVNIPICKSNLNNTSPTKKSPEETSAVKKEAPTPAVIAPESKSSQHTNSSPLTLKPAPTQVTSSKSVPLVDKTRASPSNATFPRFPLITVYINNTCFGGPHLVPEMLQKLPKQFGPGTLNKTMQDVIQMLLNCSKDRRYTFGLLRPGNGSFIVTGSVAGQKVRMTLPHFNRGVAFWNYLLNVLGGLDCCVNFISSSESQSKCTSCVGNSVTNVSTASPAMLSNKNPDKTTSSSQNRKLKNDSASSNRSGSAKRSASISLLEEAKDVTVKREKTVSTSSSTITEAEFSNPLDWSIDDVIKYLLTNDPTLEYAEVFRTHEIDGKAFLLLNSDMMMKYMKIKLGPALKICALIERLKKNSQMPKN